MRKTTILSVMAVLWPIASNDNRARIQEKGAKSKEKRAKLLTYLLVALLVGLGTGQLAAQDNKAVDVTLNGIQIGQQMPDILLSGLHNYKDASGKSVSFARLSDFKGKLLILDFWATWCSPCVAMIPRMDSLQKSFGDRVAFLSVTYQSEQEVLPFLDRLEKQEGRKSNLALLTGDQELKRLFPHRTLPHYVWIDAKGNLAAITQFDRISEKNIKEIISVRKVNWDQKQDEQKRPYDKQLPLFVANNGGMPSSTLYHSMLTGYTEGIGSGFLYFNKDYELGQKITSRNQNLKMLYRLAYSDHPTYFGNNRIVLEVKDKNKITSSAQGSAYVQWKKNGNAFCYELIVPPALRDSAFSIMRKDLNRYFMQYKVDVEQRDIPCWVLTQVGDPALLASKGGEPSIKLSQLGAKLTNIPLDKFMIGLDRFYLQNSPYPVINETNFSDPVDLDLRCSLNSVEELNMAMVDYGLAFKKLVRKVDVLVFRDNMLNVLEKGGKR